MFRASNSIFVVWDFSIYKTALLISTLRDNVVIVLMLLVISNTVELNAVMIKRVYHKHIIQWKNPITIALCVARKCRIYGKILMYFNLGRCYRPP